MNNLSRSLVTLAFLACNTFLLYSQDDDCFSRLKKAQEMFDSGLIEGIPSMLDSCIRDGFDKEQKIQAYHLLIQVYLFDYNREKAESTMMDLLSWFPGYKPGADEPVEFLNLYNQFQTKPRFSYNVSTGLNITGVNVVEQFSTGNLNNLNSEYKSGGGNPGFELSFSRYLSPHLWFTLGLGYSRAGYEVNETMNFGREILTFSENMQFAHAPHVINFALGKSGKISPFLFAGGQYSYLIGAESRLSRKVMVEGASDNVKSGLKNITGSRVRDNYAALAGVGVRFKIAAGYLQANLCYMKGLVGYSKDSSRFSDNENLFYFNYIDDRIKLNSYSFSFGYSYVFYKTTKKNLSSL